jgi:hypothetical protein
MLKIKNLMLLFSNTLQSYGFSTDKVSTLSNFFPSLLALR